MQKSLNHGAAFPELRHDEKALSFASQMILTNNSNDRVAHLYNRTSVVLPAEFWHCRLDGGTPTAVTY
jgi:putative SOS response-associated peptidase YedK